MKSVVKPLPKKPVRDLSRTPQQRTECKAAKNMTRKQQKASWKNHPSSFSSASDRGMLSLEVFLKLVELAALPQKTLFDIISHYQQKLRDQKNQMDDDAFKCGSKKIWKEVVYPTTSSFASTAHDSARNKKKAAAHTKSHKGSPYAQVPIFPRPKQDSAILRKPRKSLEKAAKNAQSALLNTRCFCERKQMQKKAQAAKRPRQSPALLQHSSLQKVWHKISEDHTDSRLFHHTACTCSSLWHAGHDPEAGTDFCGLCYLSARRRRAKQRATREAKLRPWLDDSTTGR
ncbi:EF-hand calcium-binding domain-containing protein 3 isoform 4-T5 [Ara ararauna]